MWHGWECACEVKAAHFIGVGAEEQQVEGDGGHEVDDEPAAEVVQRDLGGVRLHLVRGVHVRRTEVDEDVYYERHVHWKQWQTVVIMSF